MVVLREFHEAMIRKLKRRARIIHGSIHLAMAAIIILTLIIPYVAQLERDLAREAYGAVRNQLEVLLAKQKLLSILRTKPLTVGQALDVADVVLEQKAIPINMVLAIMDQESEFKAGAVSPMGARGLMQVMPVVYQHYASHPSLGNARSVHDPVVNLRISLLLLSDLRKQFTDWKKVLRAYNGGPENVDNKGLDVYANAVLLKAARYEKAGQW